MKKSYMARLGVEERTIEMFHLEPSLEVLQEKVGGYVELITPNGKVDVYVDEDGLMKQLPVTCILAHNRNGSVTVVGPVLFVLKRADSIAEAMVHLSEVVTRVLPRERETTLVQDTPNWKM